ncbi:hypothetical protein FD755_004070 [Muntiacus reevesi]|uniref:Deoxyuridine 5'-triphosphate nucleotidohydrolase n=1 Tax=Muntiacus reevesi TaxID=9886 RepID=A0A5J5MUA9_MUNRE|nr:hypothetical protein FD755_004070 [Muntiacus reevesi]
MFCPPCPEETQVISPSRLCVAQHWEHTTAPTMGSVCASGYDLYKVHDYTVPPMEKVLVKTNIQIALPSGCYGREAPHSDLAKHFIRSRSVIDEEDYRDISVVLFNFVKEKFEVKKGD